MNVTLTKPTSYPGSKVLGIDGVMYAVGATVTVPANIATPLIAAGFVPNGA